MIQQQLSAGYGTRWANILHIPTCARIERY